MSSLSLASSCSLCGPLGFNTHLAPSELISVVHLDLHQSPGKLQVPFITFHGNKCLLYPQHYLVPSVLRGQLLWEFITLPTSGVSIPLTDIATITCWP